MRAERMIEPGEDEMTDRVGIIGLIGDEFYAVFSDEGGGRPKEKAKLVAEGILDPVFETSDACATGIIVKKGVESITRCGRETWRPKIA